MLNVEFLPNGLKGASLIQHSTFNIQHSTLFIQHSTFNTQHYLLNRSFSPSISNDRVKRRVWSSGLLLAVATT